VKQAVLAMLAGRNLRNRTCRKETQGIGRHTPAYRIQRKWEGFSNSK